MPIIIGTTANEGNTFSFLNFMLQSQTEELYLDSLKKLAAAYEQHSPTIANLILTNYTSTNPKFSKYRKITFHSPVFEIINFI